MTKTLLTGSVGLKLAATLILGLTFIAYLRTDLIFQITNSILTMCGW